MPASRKHKRFDDDDSDVSDEGILFMQSTLPRTVEAPSSDEDDDAPPEAVSLEAGRERVLSKSKLLKEHDQETTRKRKETNKAHDADAKARKAARETVNRRREERKQKKMRKGGSTKTLEAEDENESVDDAAAPTVKALSRMERAMAQADEEDESGDDESLDQDGWTGVGGPSDSKSSPHHLPDAIFSAAARASRNLPALSQGQKPKVAEKSGTTRRPPPGRRAKDIIVGSRTVRPIQATKHIGAQISLQRSQLVREFRSKSLNVDGQSEHKPWQRIESHLAVNGRRLGPARRFAQAQRES